MTAAADTGHGLVRHGGRKLSDYFVFNTDHKVIGIQYMVLSFIFFICRRHAGGGDPHRSWRCPATQFVGGSTLQRALHDARHDHDLPVDHPGVHGLANYVIPLQTRRQRHGLPAG